MTEIDLYEAATMEGLNDLYFVADVLDRRGAAWCVIGGMGINSYVVAVPTVDCDLVVAAADLEPVLADLRAANWRIKAYPFSINAQRRLRPDQQGDRSLMVQFTQPERYQSFADRAQKRAVLGREMPVASIEDLVQGKLWALSDPSRRPSKQYKDAADVLRLAEVYPEMVEPLLPDDLRVQSEHNRGLLAQAQGEGMGEEEDGGEPPPSTPGGRGGRGRR